MKRFLTFLLFYLLLIASTAMAAGPIQVASYRYWTAPDHTRMVFDVSKPSVPRIFSLDNPPRLVIDFKNARLQQNLLQPPKDHPLFVGVRTGIRHKTDLRVVVDLKQGVKSKSFTLQPSDRRGDRVVVDLYPKVSQPAPVIAATKVERQQQAVAKAITAPVVRSEKARVTETKATKTIHNKGRNIVIAIDAGHGGEDPGAHGPKGTQEKDVVFAIAKKLAALVDRQQGMKAVLVRKGDYYIPLRKRMEIARKAKADLFVSIHADAFRNAKARGASVFTVSTRGASSEAARWLAKHENASDLELAGGVSLDDKDETLASVLLDLSQTATKEASRKVGSKVLSNFKYIGHLHSRTVQKAGFMVLKSPDIPSILVETAFISNPGEERKLRSTGHQQKMASAIFKGVLDYFKEYAPADTLLASASTATGKARHVISRGETLSGIAQRYGVSMRAIKAANSMAGNQVRIGQVLMIPTDS